MRPINSRVSGLRDASVLVTGASGFLGSRLIRRLSGRTRRLVAMARGTASVAHPGLQDLEIALGDVGVPSHIEKALDGIDVVIHLAGHSGAGSSAHDPLYDLHANAGGMLSLLEAVRKRQAPVRVVFPGSRLEYGRVQNLPVSEDALLQPRSPYGVSKFASEMYLELYARLYGVSFAVARLTNPYGPWIGPPGSDYNVLNKLISLARAGGEITVYGEGSQLRDYVFVDDVVEAIVLLASLEQNVVANVGSGAGIAFRTAAETIVRVAGRGSIVFAPWPNEAQRVETGDFVADISRLRALGWEPKTSFEDGIRLTIEQTGGAM